MKAITRTIIQVTRYPKFHLDPSEHEEATVTILLRHSMVFEKELRFYQKHQKITANCVLFISELKDLPVPPSVRIPVTVHFAGRLINSNEVRVFVCVRVCLQMNKAHVQLVPVIKPYR